MATWQMCAALTLIVGYGCPRSGLPKLPRLVSFLPSRFLTTAGPFLPTVLAPNNAEAAIG